MTGFKKWQRVGLSAVTALIVTSCASQPPLPTDVVELQSEVKKLREALAECEKDLDDCADFLGECEGMNDSK